MELKNLLSFVTVADVGNFTEAARRLNTTQSSISRHIKILEDELGTTLFERSKTDVTITESGKILLKRARIIIKETREAVEEIASIKGELCGELHIGVGSFIEPYIREFSLEFLKRYPRVRLFAKFYRSQDLNKMLKNEEIDLAFTMNNAYDNEGIVSTPCIPFKISAIMREGHELASKEKVTFDDLMKCRVFMPDVGERVFQTFEKYAKCDLSKLDVAAAVSNPDALVKACMTTDYITFLPSDYIIHYHGVVARPIENIEMELMSNAHWLKNKRLKASAKAFIDIIKEVMSKK